jgi:hypothetical protein
LRALPVGLLLLFLLCLSPAECKAEESIVSDNYSCGWTPGIGSSYYWGQSFVASSTNLSAFSFFYNGTDYGDNVSVNWVVCSNPNTGNLDPYGPFNPCDPSYSGVYVMATGTASITRLDGWQKITLDSPIDTEINGTYGITFIPSDNVSACGEPWTDFASGKIAGTYGSYSGDFSYRIYSSAVIEECAEGFIAVGEYCVKDRGLIAGYLYPLAPYECYVNQSCQMPFYYNQNYIPNDTNTINFYLGPVGSSTFVASSTIVDYNDMLTMAGGSSFYHTFTTPGKFNGRFVVAADDQDADGAWVSYMDFDILVASSSPASSTIDSLIQKASGYLKNAFPFNFFFAIKSAWTAASSSTLPTDLDFLDATDDNGDISVNLPAITPGSPTSTLVLYSDNFIATSTAAAIKGASKWVFHGLLAALIVLIGIKIYKEFFGINSDEEEKDA